MHLRNLLHTTCVTLILATSADAQFSRRYYVDANTPDPNGTGRSWDQAFGYVPDALEAAETFLLSDSGPVEIWVANGTYRPDQTRFNAQGSNDRSKSFVLVPETVLFGGFAGGETERSQRDWSDPAKRTVLTGEIGLPGTSDNSFHVIDGSFSNSNSSRAAVDGFTVTRGAATGLFDAGVGGGYYSEFGAADLFNCTFEGNVAVGSGGGAYLEPPSFRSPRIVNCRFTRNAAFGRGAALALVGNSAILSQCLFARNGGASEVSPQQNGGALLARDSGELFVYSSTIVNNLSDIGGGLIVENSATMRIRNSILWGNVATAGPSDQASVAGELFLSDAAIEGGLTGLDAAGGSVTVDTPGTLYDVAPEFADEIFDDYRLRSTSPYLDLGEASDIQADVADLDGDGDVAESIPRDLGGGVRVRGAAVGLGPYEGGTLGSPYCNVTANSTGVPSTVFVDGTGVAGDTIRLRSFDGPPQQFGFFLVAQSAGVTNFPGGSMGILCLGGQIGRVNQLSNIFQFNAGGVSQTASATGEAIVDTSQLPSFLGAIQSGETWRFQAWHRDRASSNFSTPMAVLFE